jgi:hypothetical protein
MALSFQLGGVLSQAPHVARLRAGSASRSVALDADTQIVEVKDLNDRFGRLPPLRWLAGTSPRVAAWLSSHRD